MSNFCGGHFVEMSLPSWSSRLRVRFSPWGVRDRHPVPRLGTDTPSGDRHHPLGGQTPRMGTDTIPRRFPHLVLTGFTGFTGLRGAGSGKQICLGLSVAPFRLPVTVSTARIIINANYQIVFVEIDERHFIRCDWRYDGGYVHPRTDLRICMRKACGLRSPGTLFQIRVDEAFWNSRNYLLIGHAGDNFA